MRGSRPIDIDLLAGFGIIPAHAGLTHLDPHHDESLWDHPRACGAHHVVVIFADANAGSSPRMRGSLGGDEVDEVARGIIPAHAGLT